jgi:hypothetical protein
MRNLLAAAVFACVFALGGCSGSGSYMLEGRVVRSDAGESFMTFVAPDDPRLAQSGVANVKIVVERDPTKLGRSTAATAIAAGDGSFAIPLSQFGAGWMDEHWGIRASRAGYSTVDSILALPRAKDAMQLLIMISPGFSDEDMREHQDFMNDYEQFR